MTSDDDIIRAEHRLRDALGAAAELMQASQATARAPAAAPSPSGAPGAPVRRRSGRAWLVPLAAAAAVVAVVLASVLATGNLGGRSHTGGGTAPTAGAAAAPEFYMVRARTSGSNWPLEVRRTADGALTDSSALLGNLLNNAFITADASDRAFYIANTSPGSCTGATMVARFYRITINGSGRITGYHAVGSPVTGPVSLNAVSPDGSQMAYTTQTSFCSGPGLPVTEIHVMNLSTGVVRTWQNTVTATGPDRVTDLIDGLSWTPDGSTVVAVARWGSLTRWPTTRNDISVLGLDTMGAGGSLQASSRVLLSQDQNCVACVQGAVAGPDGSLTAVEVKQGRQLVVRIPPGAVGAQTVLYSAQAPPPADADFYALSADPSGRWVITWPPYDMSRPGSQWLLAGWIRDGKLVSMPVSTDSIAW